MWSTKVKIKEGQQKKEEGNSVISRRRNNQMWRMGIMD
jgi:hypothetical protein